MRKISNKTIKARNRLLRQLPETACSFKLGNYDVKVLDIHLHLPDFMTSPRHSHSYFEIHLIFSGSGKLVTYEGERTFEAGDLLITSPEIEHSWYTDKDNLYMHVISFELHLRNDSEGISSPLDIVLSQLGKIEYHICPSDGVEKHVDKIITEMSDAKPGLNYMLQSYVKELVISIIRQVNDSLCQLSEPLPTLTLSQEDPVVVLVNKYLTDNFTSGITLDMIARFVAKSKRSITRHYKEVTGMTIIDKLLQMRLFVAEHLLTNTDKPVKTIAYEVGLPDVSYFCRQFKKFFDCTPTKYRELNPPKHANTNGDNAAPVKFSAIKP